MTNVNILTKDSFTQCACMPVAMGISQTFWINLYSVLTFGIIRAVLSECDFNSIINSLSLPLFMLYLAVHMGMHFNCYFIAIVSDI